MLKSVLAFVRRYKQEVLIFLLSMGTILVFIPVFTYLYFAHDLTSKESIMNRNNTGVVLTDRNNKPFFTFYQAKVKDFVSLNDISPFLQNAVIAVEDKRFYSHPGFSIRAIIRSLFLDILKGQTAYGGSTITQQLVKNSLLTSQKSFLRKYQEIVLAEEIERRYSKKEILEMYLNSVYFGEGAFGIEEAALTYFGKSAKNLDLAEASMLAGILPAPSKLSPLTGNFQEAKQRQKVVLSDMTAQGYITSSQAQQAASEKLVFHKRQDNLNSLGAHFALMVLDDLKKRFGEETISRSGFRVKTTLDLSWQKYAEEVVRNQVTRLAQDRVLNGAAVAIDPKTGEIEAMVGSENWYNTKFGKLNMAITPRSVGSSFKPIIYAAAFDTRLITPATVLKDVPTTFPGNYKPLDFDRKFRGNVLVRRALSNSLNIPAVEVMQKVGVPLGLDYAKKFGITSLKGPSDYGLSLVLGSGEVPLYELTNVYAMFANQGVLNQPASILEIRDKSGQKIYTHHTTPQAVLNPEVAFLISSILSDNAARAEEFGNALTISRTAAVKTGTAEDYRDALTLGYTPSLAVGVWVGNNDNSPMDQIAGALGAAPIWRLLMERFLAGTPIEKFTPPGGIIELPICRDNGLLYKGSVATSSAMMEYFISGTQPQRYCNISISPTPSVSPSLTPTLSPTLEPSPTPTMTPVPTPTNTTSPQVKSLQKLPKRIGD